MVLMEQEKCPECGLVDSHAIGCDVEAGRKPQPVTKRAEWDGARATAVWVKGPREIARNVWRPTWRVTCPSCSDITHWMDGPVERLDGCTLQCPKCETVFLVRALIVDEVA